ncbi:MAG: hypothetical protein FRX49_06494 [Trebouxia sp. A1-2]|nr:MAG: hypothetical protein FRX49_06494 [Trebouxia sp. A1-2]
MGGKGRQVARQKGGIELLQQRLRSHTKDYLRDRPTKVVRLFTDSKFGIFGFPSTKQSRSQSSPVWPGCSDAVRVITSVKRALACATNKNFRADRG